MVAVAETVKVVAHLYYSQWLGFFWRNGQCRIESTIMSVTLQWNCDRLYNQMYQAIKVTVRSRISTHLELYTASELYKTYCSKQIIIGILHKLLQTGNSKVFIPSQMGLNLNHKKLNPGWNNLIVNCKLVPNWKIVRISNQLIVKLWVNGISP